MKLNPQLIKRQGKSEFVVLPIEEFEAMTELIEDYEDLRELRDAKAKSQGQKSIPIKEVIGELGL
ncbi:MAG: type II toxin-antitoxin system Phd/YefM family antitoxin [Candidatus Electrothrix sp. AUS1_2]|jgi:PHD/YefM family antitoxin component YafN of YafNO toxin-antitoxin module|nr:type II toxin-antitoxin system Phd/YefM family antitoxin [Candidatus Electrothrix sp. AUS1_2]